MNLFILINSFLLIFAIIINTAFAYFLFVNSPKNEINKDLSLIILFFAIWAFFSLLFVNINPLFNSLFFRRSILIGLSFLPALILKFSLVLSTKQGKIPNLAWFLLPGIVCSFLLVFSPIEPLGFYCGCPVFGFGLTVFMIYSLFCYLSALAILLYGYFKDSNDKHILCFAIGFFLLGAGVIFSNMLLPLFGNYALFYIGPIFSLFLILPSVYVNIKYKMVTSENSLWDLFYSIVLFVFFLGTIYILYLGKISFLFTFYVITINLFFGLFVVFRSPKNRINIIFFFITLLLALWSFGVYLFWNTTQTALIMNGGKLAFFSASLLPSALLYFSLVFPEGKEKMGTFYSLFIAFPVTIYPLLIYFNFILKDVDYINGKVYRSYGEAYPFLLFYSIIYLLWFFYNLINKEKKVYGIYRTQIKYVFFGFSISALIAIMTNLILPFCGIGGLSFIGPNTSLIMITVITYAIIRHRLMSVDIIIKKGTVYALATGLILTLYVMAVIFSEGLFRRFSGQTSAIFNSLTVIVLAILYQPLISGLQYLADTLFLRGRYDYQKTLQSVSKAIATKIKMEELSHLIVTSFIETMRVSEISFLIYDDDRQRYRSVPLSLEGEVGASRYKRLELDEKSPIVNYIKESQDILVFDELKEGSPLRDEMERLSIAILVPILSHDNLIGIISLGAKLSGDIYSYEDIGLLFTLANQTAVALENARLYEEVLNINNYTQEILESMVIGVLTVDMTGRIITFNPTAEKITGFEAKAVLNRPYLETFSEKSAIAMAIQGTMRNKCFSNFETNIVSKQRGLVPVSISSTILMDSMEKKMGVLLSIIDLTEIKELENKVRQADKLGALGTMAAGMAHEIKNPLSSLKVFSQLLPSRFQDEEFRNKFMEIIPKEITRIDRIIESLLGFARATAPKLVKLKIDEVIEEHLKYYADQAQKSQVKINKTYAIVPEIEGDKDQLSQVFSNLILNAIQAMPEGGELTVKIDAGKKVEDVLQDVVITVSDTGHGIPEDNLKKLFDPFFTTKYGGTGLGLTISHSIIDGHRGSIDVESTVGKGTTFRVTLPISQGLL